mmetsp:Transcript_5319/g.8064  ORF Transcript_5319/g.8064 Transcript_5319/m.8064 type:complete len:86 (-) Transcript_5319:630-887(-)
MARVVAWMTATESSRLTTDLIACVRGEKVLVWRIRGLAAKALGHPWDTRHYKLATRTAPFVFPQDVRGERGRNSIFVVIRETWNT